MGVIDKIGMKPTHVVVLLSRSTHHKRFEKAGRSEHARMNQSKPHSSNRRRRHDVNNLRSRWWVGDPRTNGRRSERTTNIRVISFCIPINSFPVFRFSKKVLAHVVGDSSVTVESCGTENSLCLPASPACPPDEKTI